MGTLPIARRIGVISDTHIPARAARIPDAVLRLFTGVDLILHAGDLSVLAALDQLQEIAPVHAVHGNVDSAEVIAALPAKFEIEIGGCKIGMIHNLGQRLSYAATGRKEFPQARVVVFGHSHTPLVEEIAEETGGLLLLNPGSATDRRRQPVCTVAILTIDEFGAPRAQLHDLP
jgi:putative phosphoesterase